MQGFQPIMPTYQGLVAEERLMQIVAYVRIARATAACRRERAHQAHPRPAASPATAWRKEP